MSPDQIEHLCTKIDGIAADVGELKVGMATMQAKLDGLPCAEHRKRLNTHSRRIRLIQRTQDKGGRWPVVLGTALALIISLAVAFAAKGETPWAI